MNGENECVGKIANQAVRFDLPATGNRRPDHDFVLIGDHAQREGVARQDNGKGGGGLGSRQRFNVRANSLTQCQRQASRKALSARNVPGIVCFQAERVRHAEQSLSRAVDFFIKKRLIGRSWCFKKVFLPGGPIGVLKGQRRQRTVLVQNAILIEVDQVASQGWNGKAIKGVMV